MQLRGEIAVSLSHLDFENNSGLDGGAIWLTDNSRGLVLDRCTFRSSAASGSGGGVFIKNSVCRCRYFLASIGLVDHFEDQALCGLYRQTAVLPPAVCGRYRPPLVRATQSIGTRGGGGCSLP